MVMGFSENIQMSMEYANHAFKSFGSWFVLILLYAVMFAGTALMILGIIILATALFATTSPELLATGGMMIPDAELAVLASISGSMMVLGIIVTILSSIFIYGITMRVYRGGELVLNHWGKMFVEGLLGLIIIFIYMIPYTILSTLLALGPMDNPAYLIIVGIIIPTILLIVSIMVAMMGIIKFAKEGHFGAAFHLKELFSLIANIGWFKYLGYWILISLIVGVVELVFICIPLVGLIMFVVAMPFIMIVTARFYANIYESALPAAAE
ncbi:MAG TPA: DUF4013 domain-containing protein [Methanocorpusculum sp.]|jgi:hypothetical protein|nr:DUF4013 domain-containing protein [Methanocorpusculum sp.]MDD2470512.1 DUF4013 domain-containing protein [Methanocorpusculum sp.]MDD3256666.1 DUF4013 domain-containing protein [Methanocorpusculum sp.]MDD4132457.1 DUF4013 domain-containing protein [Methanocorpusculum sp.]HKM41873.1 DUF4013 domain-containing protein [Methanocorpusculum sp.]